MDILLQTIISEFSIKAPKDPKNPLWLYLTTIEGVAAIFAIFATRRFGWPADTLLLAPAEGYGALQALLGAFIENSEMIVSCRISICSCRHLNN